MDGGLVVRHEVLGVRPKHRFVLQNPGRKHTNENVGRREQTREKVVRLTVAQRCSSALPFLTGLLVMPDNPFYRLPCLHCFRKGTFRMETDQHYLNSRM